MNAGTGARVLRLVAIVLIAGAATFWLLRGANRGWTKTSVQKKTVDEVTGIEGISYEDRFVPGVDFLAGACEGSAILAAVSFLIRKRSIQA